MKMNEIITDFKNKYKKVNLAGIIAAKKTYKVFLIEVTTFYYVVVTNRGKVVNKQKVLKRDIKEITNLIKKDIKITLSDDLYKNIKELENKAQDKTLLFSKASQKVKKIKKFISDKELKDYQFVLIVSSYFSDYLREYNLIIEENKLLKRKRKLDKNEEFIYQAYIYLINFLSSSNKDLVLLKEKSDILLNRVYKKYGNDIEHYPILMALYLLELWRENVSDKKVQIHYSQKDLERLIDELGADLISNNCDEWRENSQKIAYDIFEMLYNTRIMTKNEAKDFFKKLKGNNNE